MYFALFPSNPTQECSKIYLIISPETPGSSIDVESQGKETGQGQDTSGSENTLDVPDIPSLHNTHENLTLGHVTHSPDTHESSDSPDTYVRSPDPLYDTTSEATLSGQEGSADDSTFGDDEDLGGKGEYFGEVIETTTHRLQIVGEKEKEEKREDEKDEEKREETTTKDVVENRFELTNNVLDSGAKTSKNDLTSDDNVVDDDDDKNNNKNIGRVSGDDGNDETSSPSSSNLHNHDSDVRYNVDSSENINSGDNHSGKNADKSNSDINNIASTDDSVDLDSENRVKGHGQGELVTSKTLEVLCKNYTPDVRWQNGMLQRPRDERSIGFLKDWFAMWHFLKSK